MFALCLLVAGSHFAALLSPGPDFFLLLRSAVAQGRRQADGCASGIALANLLSMLLVQAALGLLPSEGGPLWRTLQVLGGGYFVWLGAQALRSRRTLALESSTHGERGSWRRGLYQGLLASSLNPKLPLFYAGLFSVLREAQVPQLGLLLAMGWMGGVVLCWDLALVRLIDRPRWRGWLAQRVRWLDRGCGALLLAVGGWLLLAGLEG